MVHEPPQDANEVRKLMGELERFIHDDPPDAADPLVKMALIHHQFESIHPFYDGNGRTGRIINVLYLVKEGLLDIPVLYLSRHIVRTKPDYYRLLQSVRDDDNWEDRVLYMLQAVETTATEALATVQAIKALLQQAKQRIRGECKFYSHDLINNLFNHPCTRVDFLRRDLGVSCLTATKYLDMLAADGVLEKLRSGRSNYYINRALFELLARGDAGAWTHSMPRRCGARPAWALPGRGHTGKARHLRGDRCRAFAPDSCRQWGGGPDGPAQFSPQHFLYFFPLPQGQSSLRPGSASRRIGTRGVSASMRWWLRSASIAGSSMVMSRRSR